MHLTKNVHVLNSKCLFAAVGKKNQCAFQTEPFTFPNPQVKDAGGSMTIHTFGAYFGLTVTAVLYRPNLDQTKDKQGSVYHSDLFSMIGELVLRRVSLKGVFGFCGS